MISIYLLVLLIPCFFSIVFLIYLISKLKSNHNLEIQKLHFVINELLQIQDKQKSRIVLSEQSESKLQTSRLEIDKKMLDLQNELIRNLSDNNIIE